MCPTCRERMLKNPLRVIDCKVDACKKIVAGAPRTIEYLDDGCREHFEELKSVLESLNIPFEVDTGIVRGLDYYTRTVFEFVNSEGFTLCGGGRYDGLVHEIDEKQNIPSAGFGMGLERILYFLEKEGVELPEEDKVDLYVGILGKESKARAYQIVNLGAKYTVIIGENEIKENQAMVKCMADGEQTSVPLDEITRHLV